MGRSCIDLYAHQIGVPMTQVTSFDAYVGGCPTNVSVGTRRLGLRSALLTAVGEDQVGDFVLDFLRREGVAVDFVPRFASRRTSAVILTIQPPDTCQLRRMAWAIGIRGRHPAQAGGGSVSERFRLYGRAGLKRRKDAGVA